MIFVFCKAAAERREARFLCTFSGATQTLTSVLLEGSRRGQQRRRRVVVHISADGNTSTLPAAPSLAGRTRPVSDWTPLNNKREKEPESPPRFYDNVSAEVQKGTTSRTENLVLDLIFRTLVRYLGSSISLLQPPTLTSLCVLQTSITQPTKNMFLATRWQHEQVINSDI